MKHYNSGFFRIFLQTAAVAVLCLHLSGGTLSAQNLYLENSIYNQGIEHYANGDYQAAADYLGQIVTMMPEHDQARYYLAYSCSLSGDHERALEHARILANRYPGHQIYLDLIGEFSRRRMSMQPEARSYQHDTLLSSPTSSYSVYTPPVSRPRALRKSSKKQEPATLIERIAEMIDEERFEEASDELEKLVKAEPQNAQARHYLGVLHFNQADFATALGHFTEALKLNPENFDTCFFAASCYLNQQQLAKAEKLFEQALKIKDDAFARINLADIYARSSRLNEAEQMYQLIIKKNSDYTEARVGLALVRLFQGLVEESAEIVNSVLSENPANARARYVKSQILMENRLYSESLEEARVAYENSPGNAEYRVNYALAMLRNFQVEAGMSEAREILKIWPDLIEAHLVLAEGLIMAGDTKAAAGHIATASAAGHIPQIDYLQATLAATAGDHARARSHWKKYLEGAASLPSAHVKYALFLESISDNNAAIEAYKKIVEKFPDSALAASVQADINRLSQMAIPAEAPAGPPIPGL